MLLLIARDMFARELGRLPPGRPYGLPGGLRGRARERPVPGRLGGWEASRGAALASQEATPASREADWIVGQCPNPPRHLQCPNPPRLFDARILQNSSPSGLPGGRKASREASRPNSRANMSLAMSNSIGQRVYTHHKGQEAREVAVSSPHNPGLDFGPLEKRQGSCPLPFVDTPFVDLAKRV